MKALTSLILCVLFSSIVKGGNILTIFPTPSKSHTFLAVALVKGLAKHGHNVTFLTPFPQKSPPKDYHEFGLTDVSEKMRAALPPGGVFNVGSGVPHYLFRTTGEAVENLVADPKFETFIKQDNKYDAIIVSVSLNEALLAYLSNRYDAPIIAFSTSGSTIFAGDLVANPSPYAFVPDLFTSFTDHMTFMERVKNTLTSVWVRILMHWYHYPNQQKLLDKYLPNPTTVHDVMKNVSILLSNSHSSLSYPAPLNPAVIEIGGFHVSAPKPLPNDLQDILDKATDGVIFFSLGTNVRSQDLPQQLKNAIVESFAKLKQTVLWKWDEKTIPGLSKNVYLRSWLPQNDILAHPNVRLFITHGGLLSTTEAVVRGVPLIGIPIFADQYRNIQKAVSLDFAIFLDHKNITTESFSWALNEILNNPKYGENINIRSKVLNDQIVPPIEKAVYWVEYVIRNKGAKHLQTAAIDLPLYQYLLLDVISFFVIILIAFLVIIYICCKYLLRILWKLNKNKKD